jgi:phosphoglycerol transferase MdoB-like AlkP superfamily enzyme
VLDAEGPRVFIFAITMGNHGPWREAGPPINPELRRNFDANGLARGGELLRYLDGLRQSDEMLQILLTGLQRRHREGVLAFYGDHLPSLPHAFRHFGFEEIGSDYVVWRSSATDTRQLDLPAHRLPRVVIDALRATGAIEAQGTPALVSAH